MKIMQIEQCGQVGKCMSHPSSYESHVKTFNYSKPSMVRVAEYAMQQLEAARKVDIERHEKNASALKNNEEIRASVVSLMTAVGMPEKFTQRDMNSRARYPKSQTLRAGYLTDLDRECKVNDGFDAATYTYNQLLSSYKLYQEQAAKQGEVEKREKEREEQARIAKRRADMELAAVILRYGLPIESEWSDVLEDLRKRDQRLDLAVAMEDVRGDWNEGCYPVNNALERFTIRTDEDKDIANDVLGCTHDFEDGRVFRDISWSYSRLYASVADQQLAADVQTARSHARHD